MQVKNKVILITGASSGIGKALAETLANAGATLILAARSTDKLNEVKQSLSNSDAHSVFSLDLSDSESFGPLISELTAQHPQIDILINNGGISQRGLARSTPLAVQREVMEINYFGTIRLTQLLLPTLLNCKGKVVNIASVAGKVGGQSMAGYAGSKHALIGYMDCLRAEETQHGLTVLNVCPGFVQTNISVNARTDEGKQFGEVADSIAKGITAEECARAILAAIEKNRREVVIGKGLSGWAPTIKRFFPGLLMTIAAKTNVR